MDDDIPTPCVHGKRVPACRRGRDGRCLGCKRNLSEMNNWETKPPQEKIEIWRKIIGMGYEPLPGIVPIDFGV